MDGLDLLTKVDYYSVKKDSTEAELPGLRRGAFVTYVGDGEKVALHIFHRGSTSSKQNVPYSDVPKQGHWSWPFSGEKASGKECEYCLCDDEESYGDRVQHLMNGSKE